MKRFSLILLAGLLNMACGLSTAQAVIHFEDNFDSYADQAAFEAAWTPIGCGAASTFCTPPSPLPSGILSTDTAVSTPNSILINSPVGAPLTGDSAQRNQRQFSEAPVLSPGDQLIWSFDFYDIAPEAAPFRQYVNLQDNAAPTLNNQLVSMGLNNNLSASAQDGNYYMARILGGAANGGAASAYFKLNDTGAPLRSEGWHNFKVVISSDNGTSTDYAFYVDSIISETVLNVGTTTRQYETMRLGAGVSSTQDAYFDNMRLEYIPAPTPTNTADFNGNNTIDAADYVVWRKNNGLMGTGTQATGDANGDMNVDAADYGIWRATFGNVVPGTGSGLVAGSVPEPCSIGLFVAGLAALAFSRRKR